MAMVMTGCVTIKDASGNTTTELDLDKTIAMYQLVLQTTQAAFDMWMQYQEVKTDLDTVEYARDKEEREATIQQIKDAIAMLQAQKSAIVEKDTEEKAK
jgi:hypothetical protein